MAIDITAKTNVELADPLYLLGRYKDDTGIGDGTPLNLQTHGDYVQFFLKLLDRSSITANGLPDNTTNGFQLYDALGTWQAGGTAITSAVAITAGNVTYNRFRVLGNTLEWQLQLNSWAISGSPNSILITLPAPITTLLGNNIMQNNFSYQTAVFADTTSFSVIYVQMVSATDQVQISIDPYGGSVFPTDDCTLNFHLTIPLR